MPAVLTPAVIPAGVICLTALEFFGTHFYAIPYYTGFISRVPSGGVPALNLHQLEGGGIPTMVVRVITNKPELLNATVVVILLALVVTAILAVIVVTIRLARFK